MLTIPLQYQGLHLFRPPYRECTPLDPNSHPGEGEPGAAAVWFMGPSRRIGDELRWCALRPPSLPLFIVLPSPEQVPELADTLRSLPALKPTGTRHSPAVMPRTVAAGRAHSVSATSSPRT